MLPDSQNRNDLKHLYLGSRLLLQGEDPYSHDSLAEEASRVRHPEMRLLNPYVYPPFTGYFFGWIGKLPYEDAKTAWFWLGHALLLGAVLLSWGMLQSFSPLARLVLLLGSIAYLFPLYRSTTAGQLNHFLLFLLCAIFALWRKGWRRTAAVVIGLATLIKVVPGFLLVWLAWKREWPALVCGLLTVVLLILGPATVFGLMPYFSYLEVLPQMGYGSSTWSDQGMSYYVDEGNIGVPALIYRLFAINPKTAHWFDLGNGALYLCWIWAVIVLAVCMLSCRINRRDEDSEMELGTWVLGMLLIPSLFWDHYLVLALPAWWTLIARIGREGTGDLTMVAAALCWAWINAWIVWFKPEYLSGSGILTLNATLPPVLILFGMCAWIARTGKHQTNNVPAVGGY